MDLIHIFFGISILFFLFLILKLFLPSGLNKKLCAICVASCVTWIFLLILYWIGYFEDVVILSLFMGLSVLGVFHTVEKGVKEELLVFRLPFILTLVLVAYSLITFPEDIASLIMFLLVLWVLFGLVFLYRKNVRVKSMFDKIVECCKNW